MTISFVSLPPQKEGEKKKKEWQTQFRCPSKRLSASTSTRAYTTSFGAPGSKLVASAWTYIIFGKGGGEGRPHQKKSSAKKILTFKWFPSSLVYVCVCVCVCVGRGGGEGGEGALWMERGGGGRTTPPPGRKKDMTNTF